MSLIYHTSTIHHVPATNRTACHNPKQIYNVNSTRQFTTMSEKQSSLLVDYQPLQCLKIESTVNKFTTPQNNSHDNSRLVDCAFKYNSTQITPHRLKYQISATTMSENLQNHEATIIHINSNHEATIIHINSSSHTATVSEIER